MTDTVWYISKYLTLPKDRVGGRSFLLLREMVRKGCRAVAFTSDSNHLIKPAPVEGSHECEIVDGVIVCRVRTRRYTGAKSLGRILSWIDFEWRLWRLPKRDFPTPDTIIVSSLSLLSIANGLWLRRKYRCRLVFEVRDIWPLTLVEEGGFSRSNPFVMILAAIERAAYRWSDAVVGTMPNLAEHVREVAGPRAAPVSCIPMGIDEDQLSGAEPLPLGYAEEYIPQDKFIVCHAGTIGITNALDTLLACARRMQDRDEIHFLIVGEGDLKESYRRSCADLPNVTFAPSVPKPMVQSVLARCDVLYFSVHRSDVWRFGQSLNKVIDYMLAGKPVIASYTGYPSMIDEAGSGVFVPAGDVDRLMEQILHYAAMPLSERSAQGAAGRAWLLANRRYPRLAEEYLRVAFPRSQAAA